MKIRNGLSALCGMLAILSGGSAHAADQTIVMSTTEFAPYMGSALSHQGVMVAIATEAYKREGYTLQILFLPWVRGLAYAKEGKVDGMVGIWHSEEREQWFLYAKSVLSNQVGFYERTNHPIAYKNLAALQPYVIGIVRAYANPPAFDAAHLHTEEAVDDLTNLRKLAAGRLDLALVDRAVAQYLVTSNPTELQGKLTWIEPPVDLLPLYFAVSRRTPDAEKKLAALNAGLEAMQKDGTLTRLLTQLQ